MAATYSTMQSLGSAVPSFSLPEVSTDSQIHLSNFIGKPLLIMFICNHCPYVIHLIKELTALANEYKNKDFGVIAISSNDVNNYPQDNPKAMVKFTKQYGFEFPYCYDESQQVAIDFQAACTPDFYIYDENHSLVYRGQMDGSRPSNGQAITGDDLRRALAAVEKNEVVNEQQIPSVGCNIKWKPGLEPNYI